VIEYNFASASLRCRADSHRIEGLSRGRLRRAFGTEKGERVSSRIIEYVRSLCTWRYRAAGVFGGREEVCNGKISGYLARPAHGDGKWPGVLVVHENRGLNPYIEDVARRLAVDNFVAFAPDGLTSVGGYPGDDEKGGELFRKVDREKMTQDFVAAAEWLKKRPDCTGKIGVVGFCFGGGIANTLAVRMGSDLSAAVPFYGGQPPAADVAKIKAPLLIHYAGLDQRVNAGWPAYEAALKANHVSYQEFVYENVNHGFHNDTTPRYDEAAAKLAWKRTVDFFNKNLR